MPGRSVTYFARTNDREQSQVFGIQEHDRFAHMYIVGKTGTGKTTLLETLITQDIARTKGCALIDPHGDLVARVAENVPAHRVDDLIYVNLGDTEQPYGYNPLLRVNASLRPLVASGILDVFKKMWSDAWGARMEHILRNALFALLDQEDATLADVLRLLGQKSYRERVIRNIENEQVRRFWQYEFPKYSFRYQADGIAPIQNKVGAFLTDPRLRHVLTRSDGQLRLRSIMDEGKVLLVNLAKGVVGSDSASLFGGLLVTSLGLAAYSRANMPEAKRRPFFLYVDEFQNFTTLSFADLLSELRKFKVAALLSNQHLGQLSTDVRLSVLGNAGTLIVFRLGADDATALVREFEPRFDRTDLLNLHNYDVVLKLLIDGNPSVPFSGSILKVTGSFP